MESIYTHTVVQYQIDHVHIMQQQLLMQRLYHFQPLELNVYEATLEREKRKVRSMKDNKRSSA